MSAAASGGPFVSKPSNTITSHAVISTGMQPAMYPFFDSMDEARGFAKAFVANPPSHWRVVPHLIESKSGLGYVVGTETHMFMAVVTMELKFGEVDQWMKHPSFVQGPFSAPLDECSCVLLKEVIRAVSALCKEMNFAFEVDEALLKPITDWEARVKAVKSAMAEKAKDTQPKSDA